MRLIFSLIALCLLPACQPVEVSTPELTLTHQVLIGGHQLVYSPARLPVETPLTLQLTPDQPIVSAKGKIEGISNYMGQIPLSFSFDSNNQRWQSQFMLGACTEPQMRWRLTLELTTITGQTIQLEDQFISSLN